jgi:hypothetical protein
MCAVLIIRGHYATHDKALEAKLQLEHGVLTPHVLLQFSLAEVQPDLHIGRVCDVTWWECNKDN